MKNFVYLVVVFIIIIIIINIITIIINIILGESIHRFILNYANNSSSD